MVVYSCTRDQVKQAKGQMECWIANRSHSRLEGSCPVGWRNDGSSHHEEILEKSGMVYFPDKCLRVKWKSSFFKDLINTLLRRDLGCRLCNAASSQILLAWRSRRGLAAPNENSSHFWEGNHSHHLHAGVQTHCESAPSGREPMSTEVNENNQHSSAQHTLSWGANVTIMMSGAAKTGESVRFEVCWYHISAPRKDFYTTR